MKNDKPTAACVYEQGEAIWVLLALSATFQAVWSRMQDCVEDENVHAGETTACHTEQVLCGMLRRCDNLGLYESTAFLIGILHDVGKPDTRTIGDGEVHFYKHAEAGVPIIEKILKESGLDDKAEVVIPVVKNHMRMLQAACDPGAARSIAKDESLWKGQTMAFLELLAIADAESCTGRRGAAEMEDTFSRIRQERGFVLDALAKRKARVEAERAMSPEEFARNFRGHVDLLARALKGKYGDKLSDEKIAELVATLKG